MILSFHSAGTLSHSFRCNSGCIILYMRAISRVEYIVIRRKRRGSYFTSSGVEFICTVGLKCRPQLHAREKSSFLWLVVLARTAWVSSFLFHIIIKSNQNQIDATVNSRAISVYIKMVLNIMTQFELPARQSMGWKYVGWY